MQCQRCEKEPASVYITRIINGEKTQVALCEECAGEYQQELGFVIEPQFSFHKFLANLMNWEGIPQNKEQVVSGPRCDECGLTYRAFQESGQLGCEHCYSIFGPYLEPVLRRLHGGISHEGKVPVRSGASLLAKQELDRLRAELQRLVVEEEFEKAANVRDQIRALEKARERA